LQRFGARHAGGGDAQKLVELNCFLCHIGNADNRARIEELSAGRFAWAATATLARSGLAQRTEQGWSYRKERFDEQGLTDLLPVDPPNRNCGFCHGPVDDGTSPFLFRPHLLESAGITRGLVFSPQRMHDSGMNLQGKSALDRPFDVHADRLLRCANCHVSPNNPVYRREAKETRPEHLAFDARRPSLAEFLRSPDHNFTRGGDEAMRGCIDCHHADRTHEWLPETALHLRRLRCEACHVPQVHAPAAKGVDWTVLTHRKGPRIDYRGVQGAIENPASLVVGYEPALLVDENGRLGPHNLVAAWHWESKGEPVDYAQLVAAWFENGHHHPKLVAALDADGNGVLSHAELRLENDAKIGAVGVSEPRITGEIHRYALHHAVAPARNALRDCTECHARESRIGQPLATAIGPTPLDPPSFDPAGFCVPGHDRTAAIDFVGAGLGIIVLLGAAIHAAIRFLAYRKRRER